MWTFCYINGVTLNMSKYIAILCLSILSFTNALHAEDFSRNYVPDSLNIQVEIPLDDYLFILSKSSGYVYEEDASKVACEPINVSFPIGRAVTAYDHLVLLGAALPSHYVIEIHEAKEKITLACAS